LVAWTNRVARTDIEADVRPHSTSSNVNGPTAAGSDRHSTALKPAGALRFWRLSRLQAAAIICAIALAFEGAVALAGWYAIGATLSRPESAGVPFNVALCFLLLAVAVGSISARRLRPAIVAAAGSFLISAASFVGLTTKWWQGVDGLAWQLGAHHAIMDDALIVGKSAASRMAPNADIIILLTSIALLAMAIRSMNRTKLMLGSACALLATLGGIIGVSKSLAGLPTQDLWRNTPPMSLWAGVGFIVVGLGMQFVSVVVARRANVYTGRIVPGVAATAVLLSAVVMWEALIDHDRRSLETVMHHEAVSIAADLTRSVNNAAHAVDRLVQQRTLVGGDSPVPRSVSSSQIIRDFPGVTALTWLDSAGVVRWRMAETATHDEEIGGQFARTELRRHLLREARTADNALISPPQLHSNRSASVFMAAPLWNSLGALDGYLIVELVPERLMAEILPQDFDRRYGYVVSDGRLNIASHGDEDALGNIGSLVTLPVEARRREWQLSLYPTSGTLTDYSSPLPTTFLVAAFICAVLAARIVWAAQVAEEQSEKLALTVDSLDAENEARRQAESIRDDNAELLQVQAAELAIQYRELQSTADVLAAQRDALRQAHEFSAALVRSTVDAVVAFDNEGQVHTWNPAMTSLAGWADEDLSDAHVGTLLPFLGQGEEKRIIEEALAGRATTVNAMRAAHHLWGDRVYLDLTVTPMRAPDGSVLGGLLVARDVTERQRVADMILASKEAAEAASRAKSDFLARMSHELRTPLNAVIGFTNVILRTGNTTLTKVQITYLDRIRANGKHLLALINTVLDLSKIESGTETVEMTPTSVSALVRQTVTDIEVNAAGAGQRLEVVAPSAGYATTDPSKLKQVLINLVGNAMKFTPKDGRIAVLVEVDEHTGQALRVRVEDTGIGIAADRLDAIFEAFEQADNQTAHVYGGTGLGLAISRKLCALMGHELTAESTMGEGSCFTITFQAPTAG
jgi:PAS domain S-box-containing protein